MQKLMDYFVAIENLLASNSVWDAEKFEAKTLRCATNNNDNNGINETG